MILAAIVAEIVGHYSAQMIALTLVHPNSFTLIIRWYGRPARHDDRYVFLQLTAHIKINRLFANSQPNSTVNKMFIGYSL